MRYLKHTRRADRLVLSIGLALLLLLRLPPAIFAQDIPQPVLDMVRLVNNARIQRGLAPYLLNPLLSQVAQSHVDDTIAHGRLGHVGSDGSRVATRIQRSGYSASQVSENWVYSHTLPKGFQWWMADPPHRANILNHRYVEIGVGMAPHPGGWGEVWVMDFATPANGAPGADDILIASPPSVEQAAAADTPATTYVVESGDNLDGIARRLGLTWQRLASFNDLKDPTRLQVGQVIEIPGNGDSSAAPTAEPAPAPEPSAAADSPDPVPAAAEAASEPPAAAQAAPGPDSAPVATDTTPATHVVQAGESLAAIAAQVGVGWQDLADLNGLNGRSILHVGQVIRLAGDAAPAVVAESGRIYRVQPGDSLAAIGARYGVAWQTLAELNHLNSRSILQVGQEIRLP